MHAELQGGLRFWLLRLLHCGLHQARDSRCDLGAGFSCPNPTPSLPLNCCAEVYSWGQLVLLRLCLVHVPPFPSNTHPNTHACTNTRCEFGQVGGSMPQAIHPPTDVHMPRLTQVNCASFCIDQEQQK